MIFSQRMPIRTPAGEERREKDQFMLLYMAA